LISHYEFGYNIGMDAKKIEKLASEYKKQLDKLDSETLRIMSEDRSKATEYARKGIQEVEPENLSEEYVQTVANDMQVIARMILEERNK